MLASTNASATGVPSALMFAVNWRSPVTLSVLGTHGSKVGVPPPLPGTAARSIVSFCVPPETSTHAAGPTSTGQPAAVSETTSRFGRASSMRAVASVRPLTVTRRRRAGHAAGELDRVDREPAAGELRGGVDPVGDEAGGLAGDGELAVDLDRGELGAGMLIAHCPLSSPVKSSRLRNCPTSASGRPATFTPTVTPRVLAS